MTTAPLQMAKTIFSTHGYRAVMRGHQAAKLESTVHEAADRLGMVDATREQVIGAYFDQYQRQRRDEYVFRYHLHRRLSGQRQNSFILNQVSSGDRIVDIVHVTASRLHVYEIKSPLDSPLRLEAQLRAGYAISPCVTLLVDHSQLAKYLPYAEASSVGVAVLGPRGGFRTIRKAQPNYSNLATKPLFDLLRREERNNALHPERPDISATPPGKHYRSALKAAAGLDAVTLYDRAHQEILGRKVPRLSSYLPFSQCLNPLLATLKPGRLHSSRLKLWLNEAGAERTPDRTEQRKKLAQRT